VRAPKSAQIAAAPEPATTRTVTNGPTSLATREPPTPEKSAAPISIRNTLKVKTDATVNGMDKTIAGKSDTRATNQVCANSSRHANGHLNIATSVSRARAKKSPTPRTGAKAGLAETLMSNLLLSFDAERQLSYATC